MKIYLLIENRTNRVIAAYKYSDIALINKDKGISTKLKNMISGPNASDRRIEVMEVVE